MAKKIAAWKQVQPDELVIKLAMEYPGVVDTDMTLQEALKAISEMPYQPEWKTQVIDGSLYRFDPNTGDVDLIKSGLSAAELAQYKHSLSLGLASHKASLDIQKELFKEGLTDGLPGITETEILGEIRDWTTTLSLLDNFDEARRIVEQEIPEELRPFIKIEKSEDFTGETKIKASLVNPSANQWKELKRIRENMAQLFPTQSEISSIESKLGIPFIQIASSVKQDLFYQTDRETIIQELDILGIERGLAERIINYAENNNIPISGLEEIQPEPTSGGFLYDIGQRLSDVDTSSSSLPKTIMGAFNPLTIPFRYASDKIIKKVFPKK